MRSPLRALVPTCLLLLASTAWADDVTVTVKHTNLEPAEVTISAGDTVTFVNVVEMPGGHNIVADDGSFKSDALDKGEKWSHTFDKPGEYPYHVEQHPTNKGKVIVE